MNIFVQIVNIMKLLPHSWPVDKDDYTILVGASSLDIRLEAGVKF